MQDALVLLSGGVDSAAALVVAADEGLSPRGLFVEYGQAARNAERAASEAIANHYKAPWKSVALRDDRMAHDFGSGEIIGRNAFLVHVAMLVAESRAAILLLGVHGGTTYRDCSQEFIALMQQSLDFHTGGLLRLVAPFLSWSKAEVFDYARAHRVPMHLTHSCEAGDTPCGRCASCQDRAVYDDACA